MYLERSSDCITVTSFHRWSVHYDSKDTNENGTRSYLFTTTNDMKSNEKSYILLGEVRAASDPNLVLHSQFNRQESQELISIMQNTTK